MNDQTNGEMRGMDSWAAGPRALRDAWRWILASGLAFLLIGAIALVYSVLVTLTSVVVLGLLLVIGAIFEIVHAFRASRWGGFLVELALGLLYGVVGLLMVLNPGVGAMSLTLLVAAFFIAGGLFRGAAAIMIRPPSWGWLLAGGAVTLLLGVLILAQWPVSGLWVIGLFIGIDMILTGAWLVSLAVAVRTWSRAEARRTEASVSQEVRQRFRQSGER